MTIMMLAAGVCACGAGSVGEAAFAPRASCWTRPYLDRTLPCLVDPNWIVVRSSNLTHDLTEVADGLGLDVSGARPSSVADWSYVPTRQPLSDAEIERTVRTLAAHNSAVFASPLFLGGTELLPWIPMPELIIQADDPQATDGMVVLDSSLGGFEGMVRVAIDADTAFDVLDAARLMAEREGVAWAQPNAIWWAKHFYTPNDADYPSQWALNQSNDMDMNAPECWDVMFGDSSIAVAILDDGIDQDHPDISQIPGADFTDENTGGDHTTTCDGHGSCVGGCVAATIDNGIGVTGVAPGCRVVAARIFNAIDFFGFCLGFIETTDAWIVNGIGWATQNGARVTNSSWGGGSPSSSVTSAFEQSRQAGVVHFGAAGNDSSSNISYPASLSALYAVSAINSGGNLASFSTYGNGLFCAAPGEGILTTDWAGSGGFSNGNYATVDGTSFASPYAAGVAALVLSADPSLSADEVGDIMAATCKDRGSAGYDTSYGWGIVDAAAAVDAADPGDDCVWDTSGNGQVDADDLLNVIAQWGACPGCSSDFDGDGVVGADDILALIGHWGPCA
ncbi:MAG: S8 family serine peptidase [Phycisphaerales bacterium]|nr:S8 family serine peptidase [Phycisphaerales bacterium]